MNAEVKDIAKKISEIFNSNLSIKLKYDRACELLAHIFDARIVSFLLFDSKMDSLACHGYYLNISNLKVVDNKLKTVLENIGLFDFIRYRRTKETNCQKLYSEYIKTNNLFSQASEESFLNVYGIYDKAVSDYENYKKISKEEVYCINNDTITGGYFYELLQLDGVYQNKAIIESLDCFEREKKKCSVLLEEKLKITIESNSYYLGLPLYATERYFGVIRFIFSHKKQYISKSDGKYILDREYSERFGYLSQIISLHLETNYYLEGYKKVSHLSESIKDLKKLNTTCDLICEILNCNGSLIRFSDEDSDLIEVKGYSQTLKKYVERLKTFQDIAVPGVQHFSKSLIDLFKQDTTVLAVSFSADIESSVNMFRFADNAEIKSNEQHVELVEFQSKPYLELLQELNIKQVSVVRLPNVKNGYMTFTNTQNRRFISADIEMIILAVKGISLEIKHKQDTIKINKQQAEIAQTDSMRNVVHQLGAPLHGIMGHLYNIVYKKVPDNIVNEKMLYTYHMIKNSMKQVKRFQRILELDTKPIISRSVKILSIPKYLINKSMEFQTITKNKGITIHVFSEEGVKELFFPVDVELFDEVISILLDNAAKYAFNSKELVKNNIKYDEGERKSEGNILLSFKENHDGLKITLTNWGATIFQTEKEKIFDKHYRGVEANKFSPIGSGIGLFLAQKIIAALNSNITLVAQPQKTTFIITLKRKA